MNIGLSWGAALIVSSAVHIGLSWGAALIVNSVVHIGLNLGGSSLSVCTMQTEIRCGQLIAVTDSQARKMS